MPFPRPHLLLLTAFWSLLGLLQAKGDPSLLDDFPAVFSRETGFSGETREQRFSATWEYLAARHKMTPEAVEKALPQLAEQLSRDSKAARLQKARAAFVRGDYEQARILALEAGDLAHRASPRQPMEIVPALELAAFAAMELSRHEEALKYLGIALGEVRIEQDLAAWASLQTSMACGYQLMKMGQDQLQTLRLIYTEHERLLGPNSPKTIQHQSTYAAQLYRHGRDVDAERETRAVLKATERLRGPEHEETQVVRKNLARVLEAVGRHAEAEGLRRQVVASQMKTLGGSAAATLRSREQLIQNLFDQRKHAEAEAEATLLHDHSSRGIGHEARSSLSGRISLALAIAGQGRHEEALQQLRPLLADVLRLLGPEDSDTLKVKHALGVTLNTLQQHQEAAALLEKVVSIRQKVLPPDDLMTIESRHQLGIALMHLDRHEEALPHIRIAATAFQRLLRPDDPRLQAANQTGDAFARSEKGRLVLIREQTGTIDQLVSKLGQTHAEVLTARVNTAVYLAGIKAHEEALKQLETALAGCIQTLGRKHSFTLDVMQKRALTLFLLQRWEEAEKRFREICAVRAEAMPADDLILIECRYRHGLCLSQLGRSEEAASLIETCVNAVQDRKDVNPSFAQEMRQNLSHLRQPQPSRTLDAGVTTPGTLNKPLSLASDRAASSALPQVAPAGTALPAPSMDPAALAPPMTIQKPVEYKP